MSATSGASEQPARRDGNEASSSALSPSSESSCVASSPGPSCELVFDVRGMTCVRCAQTVERALRRTPGVHAAHVDATTGRLSIDAASDLASREALEKTFEALRHRGYIVEARGEGRPPEDERLEVRLAVAAFFTMHAMALAWSSYVGGLGDAVEERWVAFGTGLLALPVVVWSAAPVHRRALASLEVRAPGMDFLVSLGSLAAFALSLVQLARGATEVFFDTSAGIVTFALVGRLLEGAARRRALAEVRSILEAAPERARRAGSEERVAVRELAVGELVEVRAGERVPVDLEVTSGAADVDRSLLTGESLPVARTVGDRLEAGTHVVDGTLVGRIVARFGERRIDAMARDIERMMASRGRLRRVADRLAGGLVPVVLVLAMATALGHLALGRAWTEAALAAVSVVVIACPCALGLATPMALVAAAGRAARRGFVFRDGEALERAAEVSVAALDKTGTLTEGRFEVVRETPAPGVSRERLLTAVALAEHGTTHPVGVALGEHARSVLTSKGIEVPRPKHQRTVPGMGARAETVEGRTVNVGRASFVGCAADDAQGSLTRVEVSEDGEWLGRLELSDRIRPSTTKAVEQLRAQGLELVVLTGDAWPVARAVGERLGLAVEAELLPEDKARIVERLAARGRVAFVGDGLNDGLALAAAHLAVASSGATDLAQSASHLALREDGIARLPEALELARRTVRVMRRNVGWAIAYNALALPLAVMGFVRPELAALAMGASSISVALSSLGLAKDGRARERPRIGSAAGGDALHPVRAS